MRFPFYIAVRYLFSKKSHHAINIISGISVCGVTVATIALICTLSVFNGFHDMVASFFTSFDPELKITAVKGKNFKESELAIDKVKQIPEIVVCTPCLEDQALLRYRDRQQMVTIKGVDESFQRLTSFNETLYGNGCFEPETAQGMGWHNVQERVAGMNGVVDVTSRPGEGTEVSIVLPACK